MKTLIVTMHRVTNYGSVLQAYALQEKIRELGFDVQILDYYPIRQSPFGLIKRIGQKVRKPYPIVLACQIVMIPSYIKRNISFKKFWKKRLNLTCRYKTINSLCANIPEADIYCTGSDQVWNYIESEQVDGVYFWSFIPRAKRKIAYAASIGLSYIEEVQAELIKKYLDEYDWISVRENQTIATLENIGLRNIDTVVDPIFLYEVDYWKNISQNMHIKEEYMLVYNLHRSSILDKYALEYSRKYNLKIIYVGFAYHEMYKKGRYYCAPPVEKYLGLLINASFILSDSFHATAFAILFNKKFRVFCPAKYSIRITELLNIFSLNDLLLYEDKTLDYENVKLDFDKINDIIRYKREESITLLKQHLGVVRND